MANLHGYGSDAVGNLVNHYTRHNGDPDQTKYRYANQNIHPERTKDNYALYERPDPAGYVRDQMARATVKPKVGGKKETNVLSDWVVTLPKNPALVGREREFFEQAYAFLCERVPEDMRLGAWVHMDENQPHMHFAFCPLLKTPAMTNDKSKPLVWTEKDEKKDPKHKAGTPKLDTKGTPRYERVQKTDEHGNPVWNLSFGQSKVFTREKMKTFHADLEKAMEQHFGFVVGIQLEDPGEKQLSKLGQKDYIAAKKTLEKQKAQIAENAERLECLRQARSETQARVDELGERIIIAQQGGVGPRGEYGAALGAADEALGRAEDLAAECQDAVSRSFKGGGVPECADSRDRESAARAATGGLADRLRDCRERLDGLLGRLTEAVRGLARGAWDRLSRLGLSVAYEEAELEEPVSDGWRGGEDGVSLAGESRAMRAASGQLDRGGSGRRSREGRKDR